VKTKENLTLVHRLNVPNSSCINETINSGKNKYNVLQCYIICPLHCSYDFRI